MTRRPQLSEAQIGTLFDPLTDQRELVRHYTLSDADLAMIQRCRGDQADGRAINEKVRLYARVGAALISAREAKRDAFDAITAVLSWDRFGERPGFDAC